MALACCYDALPLMLLGQHHSALLIMFPAYPMVLTVMLYSLLSGHFATVGLRCCRHAALPLYMLLTTVHVAYHCPAALPLSYSLASNNDCQFYALCHHCSAFHCLTTWVLCHLQVTLVVSYCFASVIWVNHCHASLPCMLFTHCYIAQLVILLCLRHIGFVMLIATGMLSVFSLGLLGEVQCLTALLRTCNSLSLPSYLVGILLSRCYTLTCLLAFSMLKRV